MSRLSASERNALTDAVFALPEKRKFPLTDAEHDRKALQLVPRSLHAGNITPAEASTVRRKARAALSHGLMPH